MVSACLLFDRDPDMPRPEAWDGDVFVDFRGLTWSSLKGRFGRRIRAKDMLHLYGLHDFPYRSWSRSYSHALDLLEQLLL